MGAQAPVSCCFSLALWLLLTATAGAQADGPGAQVEEAGAQADSLLDQAKEAGATDSMEAQEDDPAASDDDAKPTLRAAPSSSDIQDSVAPAGEDQGDPEDKAGGAGDGEGAEAKGEEAGAQGEEADVRAMSKPALRATAFSSDFRLDGKLDDPAWITADSIENLVTVEPEEGGVPAGQTTAKVLVTPDEIIIGVMCYDKNPARIVSYSKARDAELEQEDHVLIVLDPFQDGRSGYVFAVNPSGARVDGLVSAQGEEFNRNWDAVWEAKTSRTTQGWSAEILIPIKSLSFKKGLTAWGLNVQRRVQRLQETSRWSGASLDYEIFQTSRAGLLTDLPAFDYGLGLNIRPAFVTRTNRLSPTAERDYDGDVSLDVTQKLGPNLVASATVNTDFAETEVDARQTNLTRFDVFFPEKRAFFLEGSDIFDFGVGMDEEILVPFFTRRIGLFGEEDDLVQVPLTAGGKVNGRVGNTNLAALAVRAGSVDSLDLPATTMGAVRVQQNLLSESSVGALATFGDPQGRADSWMAGLDAIFRTSSFLGDKNFLAGVWGLGNGRAGLDGDKVAYGGKIAYPNDLLDLGVQFLHIGDGFQPSLGFVPRAGKFLEVGGEFAPRPAWPLVRQMVHELTYFGVFGLDDRIESYQVTIKPLDWLLESGDRVEFLVLPEGERLSEPFDIADDILIPTDSYHWVRYSVGGFLAEKRTVSGGATYSFGGFYTGDLNTLELTLAVKPWPVLLLELGAERNSASLPEGDFTEELYSGRVELRYSSDLQFSSLLQYDNESESFGTNTRLRWTFHPLGDLFFVYNHNLARSVTDRLTFDSNELMVKLQYALRL